MSQTIKNVCMECGCQERSLFVVKISQLTITNTSVIILHSHSFEYSCMSQLWGHGHCLNISLVWNIYYEHYHTYEEPSIKEENSHFTVQPFLALLNITIGLSASLAAVICTATVALIVSCFPSLIYSVDTLFASCLKDTWEKGLDLIHIYHKAFVMITIVLQL